MKNVLFVFLFLFSEVLQAQCPASYQCNTFIELHFENSIQYESSLNIYFNFGEFDYRTGIYPAYQIPQEQYTDFTFYIQCELNEVIQIEIFADNQSIGDCVLANGTLCIDCPTNLPDGDLVCLDQFAGCEDDFFQIVNEVIEIWDEECQFWDGACNSTGLIFRNGPVTVGGLKNNDALQVPDGIISSKSKVENCQAAGWCDYVFKEDYELLCLEDLKAFISKNKHLPGIPSAQEVIKNGFSMTNITLGFQIKIEEAYLYLIAIEKELTSQEATYNYLKKENEFLKTNSK